MRILITGSRSWTAHEPIHRALWDATQHGTAKDITIVHGGARGADTIADAYARNHGWAREVHRPDYAQHSGKRAPLLRNLRMVSLGADLCLAFPIGPGWSGTRHCMQAAGDAGIPVEVTHA